VLHCGTSFRGTQDGGKPVNRRKTVFVSHAQADREFARSLVVALSERLPPNIQFVLDADVVSPGENVFVRIADTLSKADALIVIISQASASSAWVRSEVAWALAQKDGKLPIFPVLNGPPDAIPHLLRSRVYIDFSDSKKFSENVARLAEAILRNLETPRSVDTASYIESIEGDFIEMQREILETQRRREFQERRLLSARLGIAIVLLITLSVVLAVVTVIFMRGGGNLYNIVSIVIAPLTGLIGTILGFYFGNSSARGVEGREGAGLKREREAS
jgi:TIR domain